MSAFPALEAYLARLAIPPEPTLPLHQACSRNAMLLLELQCEVVGTDNHALAKIEAVGGPATYP
jgi:hypothetical protein